MIGNCLRGMVFEINLDPVVGHEQGQVRPCVVIQNDIGNSNSSTTIVAPLTDAANIKRPGAIHVMVKKGDGGTTKDSYALCDQIRTVDMRRLRKVFGILSNPTMDRLNAALKISLVL
jgi:mRNA interferase MazF